MKEKEEEEAGELHRDVGTYGWVKRDESEVEIEGDGADRGGGVGDDIG